MSRQVLVPNTTTLPVPTKSEWSSWHQKGPRHSSLGQHKPTDRLSATKTKRCEPPMSSRTGREASTSTRFSLHAPLEKLRHPCGVRQGNRLKLSLVRARQLCPLIKWLGILAGYLGATLKTGPLSREYPQTVAMLISVTGS